MAAPFPIALPWRPELLYGASAACHIGAVPLALASPSAWPWVLAAVALNHLLITVQVLTPRSRWLGENPVRLPAAAVARREVCITIDDGRAQPHSGRGAAPFLSRREMAGRHEGVLQ